MTIGIEQVVASKDYLVLDVRSREEFERGGIPGALSYPLFEGKERSSIGELYHREGREAALQEAFALIGEKFEPWLEGLLALVQGRKIAIHCARGGMRSLSVVVLLRALQEEALQVVGGYKAYRQILIQFLQELPTASLITLYGLTGTGKTQILHKLNEKGYPVLDLEALANHRGSVFGHIAKGGQPTQQWFESHLFRSLRALDVNFCFTEGESKKIGTLLLPENLVRKMQQGLKVHVTSSLEERVKRVVQEYTSHFEIESGGKEDFEKALFAICRHLGPSLYASLQHLLKIGDVAEFSKLLLTQYYDQRYKHTRGESSFFDFEINSDNLQEAVSELQEWVRSNTEARC